MKKFVAVLFAAVAMLAAAPSFAQQKCEGPPDLCAQIVELNSKIEAQKALSDKAAGE